MSFAAIADAQKQAVALNQISLSRKDWTRADVEAFEATGAFLGQRFELLEGELFAKVGKLRPHSLATQFLHLWLIEVFGGPFINQEASIDLRPEDNPTSAPEPDLVVLRQPWLRSIPGPSDLRLVIEVSDSTLAHDLALKARLYSRSAILEYWVVDVNARRVRVHREPSPEGYRSVAVYEGLDPFSPLEAPDSQLTADAIFSEH